MFFQTLSKIKYTVEISQWMLKIEQWEVVDGWKLKSGLFGNELDSWY